MKILFVIASLQSGGAERVLTTLANHWANNNMEICILTSFSQEVFYKLNDNIKLLPLSNMFKNPILNTIPQIHTIRNSINSEQPDIVISFMSVINIFTLVASTGLKVPIIISERNYYEELQQKHWRLLRRITYPSTDGMVVLSKYDYGKYKYVNNKQIILNPLDTHSLSSVNINQKEKLLIAVGSLTKRKGFDMLIEALSKVYLVDWKCYIIGEGPERESLTSLIEYYNLSEKVILIGKKSNIYDYYTRASVFVLSSRYEGFPNVLAEAMAHGCSCIAFDCKTGPSDIITNGVNGVLVEANNVEKLHQSITSIISNPQIRSQFFDASLQIREKNQTDKIAQVWEQYIKHIINIK
jgi:GalNAc-alpha-(1->4)-GalNAc-alpha-(1->3)-diNAcBac-PP-undecaprenol alpha-1,4-N-acetyl-D-galactosaminyltransferase